MTKPLKIVFYIHALAGGGAERVWVVLASGLARRGHDVVMAVDYEARENLKGLDPRVRTVSLGGSHIASVLALRRLLRSESPDVVVGALAAANLKLTAAAALAGRLSRTVLTWHGYAESEPRLLSQIGFWALPLLTRLTARTVAVSDGLLGYLRHRWRACPNRTVRIYNPVEVGRHAHVSARTDEAPTLLAAGRLVTYKNFQRLLQAFAKSKHLESRLVLLGDGPERENLWREVARLGLGARVEMPGYIDEPWRYYVKARCFVLPSQSEAFGLVLVEAMAHGLEIVATDCDGPREILEGGRHGSLVPVGDVAAMAAAIDAAIDAPTDAAARTARAREFDVAVATEAYEALFHEVATAACRRRPGVTHPGKPARLGVARGP